VETISQCVLGFTISGYQQGQPGKSAKRKIITQKFPNSGHEFICSGEVKAGFNL
jgi:hypothetical protein